MNVVVTGVNVLPLDAYISAHHSNDGNIVIIHSPRDQINTSSVPMGICPSVYRCRGTDLTLIENKIFTAAVSTQKCRGMRPISQRIKSCPCIVSFFYFEVCAVLESSIVNPYPQKNLDLTIQRVSSLTFKPTWNLYVACGDRDVFEPMFKKWYCN